MNTHHQGRNNYFHRYYILLIYQVHNILHHTMLLHCANSYLPNNFHHIYYIHKFHMANTPHRHNTHPSNVNRHHRHHNNYFRRYCTFLTDYILYLHIQRLLHAHNKLYFHHIYYNTFPHMVHIHFHHIILPLNVNIMNY